MDFFTGQRMLIGLGLLALAAALAGAGEPVARELQAAAAAVNQESRDPGGPSHVVTALAALFDLGAETIESERAATGLGFGEIAIAHAIVEATGGARTFQQVVAMKQSGLGWGQVVHALHNEGVIDQEHLGPIVSQARRTAAVAGALREAAATSKGKGRGETASSEARAGR
ncbi:MAG: hypothetical protein HYT86_09065, partial [candidate division NC10 bacterium]|nr:hypothetical protein [candidate division NC10 bacterium]